MTPARAALGAAILLLAACALPSARHADAAWPTPTLEPGELVASFPDSASVQRRQLSAAHDARAVLQVEERRLCVVVDLRGPGHALTASTAAG